MKKKKILIIAIIALIILPISVFAASSIISKNANNIDYSKLNYSEEEFINNRNEKAKMQKEYLENAPDKVYTSTSDEAQNIKNELQQELNKKDEEKLNNFLYILDIVKQYYPDEVNTILKEAEIENEEMNNSGEYIEISKSECKLINLIVDIINEENLTKEESKILKEYIGDQIFRLKEIGNLELVNKIENILN